MYLHKYIDNHPYEPAFFIIISFFFLLISVEMLHDKCKRSNDNNDENYEKTENYFSTPNFYPWLFNML